MSTLHWRRTSTLDPDTRLAVLHLLNLTESRLNRESLEEGRRRNVVHGWQAEHWLGYNDGDELAGYAQLMSSDVPLVEVCGGQLVEGLAHAILAHYPAFDVWIRGAQATSGHVERVLQLLTIDLPVPEVPLPAGSHLRTFDANRDEETWLAQNNAAFASHPEQGAWRPSDLHARIIEPWFDPSGFLLLEIDERLAASCWTKVHELSHQRFGEIYVISVSPDFQGQGLGRVMATAGLKSLRSKGVTVAKLFVDESNTSANKLYASLGFVVERRDELVRVTR